MKLRDVTVLGHTLEIEVDEASGEFTATSADLDPVHSATLNDLRDKVRVAIRKAALELNIPFIRLDGTRGTVRGIHASRYQTLLVTWEDGSKGTITSSDAVLKPDAPVAELIEITEQIALLETQRNTIVNDHMLDLRQAYNKATEIDRAEAPVTALMEAGPPAPGPKRRPKVRWRCGFRPGGQHSSCTVGYWHQPTRQVVRCDCANLTCRARPPRCLHCGADDGPLTDGWECVDSEACQAAVEARSAANPVRAMLAEVHQHALTVKQQALAARILYAVGDDEPGDGPARRPRPKGPDCQCGCGGSTKGGRFLPGHDAKLKGRLKRAAKGGDQAAADELARRGW